MDFYAPQIKLAVELDGSQHYEANSKNHLRDEALARNGIMVVRYFNNDIDFNLKAFLEDISLFTVGLRIYVISTAYEREQGSSLAHLYHPYYHIL